MRTLQIAESSSYPMAVADPEGPRPNSVPTTRCEHGRAVDPHRG